MKNIMKSIGYEIMRSKMMIRLYIFFVLIMILVTVLNINMNGNGSGASGLLADNPGMVYQFPIFIMALVVGIICGEDYKDKVACYEILSGHSRISIFFARSIMGIAAGALLSTILCFVPMVSGIIIAGWGNTLSLRDIVIRQVLFLFPFMRLGAFLAVLTFLVKNQYVIMAVGFILSMSGEMLGSMFTHAKSFYISIYNFNLLTDYNGWSIYNLDPGKGIVNYYSYDSSVSCGLVVGTIACSLLMTALYLFMGYALFRRDEMN